MVLALYGKTACSVPSKLIESQGRMLVGRTRTVMDDAALPAR